MAEEVARAIVARRIAVIEAGVGIGKTFAYLIPILMERHIAGGHRPILVSTKTINLQEQLARKDLPFISGLLRKSGIDIGEVILSKGMSHYCCAERLQSLRESCPEGATALDEVEDWLIGSPDGDMSGGQFPRSARPLRHSLCVENCDGACHKPHSCQYFLMRARRAASSGVIVTNHNQLANHLAKRQKGEPGLWLDPFAVVIDEAHSLEDAIRNELSLSLCANDVGPALVRVGASLDASLVRSSAKALQKRVEVALKGVAVPRDGSTIRAALGDGENVGRALRNIAVRLRAIVIDSDATDDRGRRPRRRKPQALQDISRTCEGLSKRFLGAENVGQTVFWAEPSKNGGNLVAAPLDVGPFLAEQVWKSTAIPAVLTSATLGMAPDLSDFRESLGLPANSRVSVSCFPPCFDYPNRVMIYVPRDISEPSRADGEDSGAQVADEFCRQISARIHTLLDYSRGRALLLFTSYQRLNTVYSLLRGVLDYRVLRQGNASPGELLSAFRRDKDSVLFATGAFWEGTDVSGEALSMVIMDKLPFPVPSEPLVAARSAAAEGSGLDAFDEVIQPTMLRMLRQGAGRLVRQEDDEGVIAILDVRAWTRHYEAVKKALPPAPWTDNLSSVKSWFETHCR